MLSLDDCNDELIRLTIRRSLIQRAATLLYIYIFYFSLSFIGFTYFLLLSMPSLSTRIVPLHFQAGGRRK